mmetsp:Transcript_43832/g.95816  ORF Transcript_43832/g.95816 Transcript_43832/m.95816 type:complete len:104 (-) Transcript_43832:530-841(-)
MFERINKAAQYIYPLGKMVGHVVSARMDKTVKVHIPYKYRDPKTMVYLRRRTKIFVHDEYSLCSPGDLVEVQKSRKLSKRKAHVLKAIMQREDGSTPPEVPAF